MLIDIYTAGYYYSQMKTIHEMTNDLLGGMSQQALADIVGTSQVQICRISNGQEPKYGLGREIERIYERQIRMASRAKAA